MHFQRDWHFFLLLFVLDLNLNLEGGIAQRVSILRLCSHNLPRVLFLWLDRPWTLPRQSINTSVHITVQTLG